MSRIFLKYDQNNDGGLDYSEFMRLVNFVPKADAGRERGGRERVVSAQLREETDALVDRIRRRLEDNLGSSANSARRIKETFADIDTDGSGGLSKRELSKALAVLKVDLTARELECIFERYDSDNSGEIDYSEFLRLVDYRPVSPRQTVESKY